MNRIWEGCCSLCIGGPCGLPPKYPLTFISIFSFALGLFWISIGIWLGFIIVVNSSLPPESQIMFEKLHIPQYSLDNESASPFVFTKLENLKFYLVAMTIISILGGFGRAVSSLCLLHYVYKRVLPYVMTWAWVILSVLSIGTLAVISVDTLYTMSHNAVSAPHKRDFYFKNDDGFHLYDLCNIFKYMVTVDFISIWYFQWVVRWAQRHPCFKPEQQIRVQ